LTTIIWFNVKTLQLLDPEIFGYGVGQGSIGVECRDDDAEVRA